MFSLLRLCLFSMARSMLRICSVFVSVPMTFHSFALSASKVSLGQCYRVSLLQNNSLNKPKANFLINNQLSSWDGFSETQVKRIHGPFELEFITEYPPEVSHCSHTRISASSGKGLNFITDDILPLLKCDGNYNWFDIHKIRKAQMKSRGKTRNMSTSQTHEINNNKDLTILRLRNANRKE